MAQSPISMYHRMQLGDKKKKNEQRASQVSIPIRRGPNDEVIPRSVIQKDLKIYEELGSGAFGKVYRAFDPLLNQVVAVKMIEMDTSNDVEEILLELKFLAELRCEQITKYHYSTLHDSVLFVMMEYCAAGSCGHLLKKYNTFTEISAAYVLHESLKGLKYIHEQNKIHRDLKSANILVTHDYGVKIADFGVSAQLSRTMPERNSFMGTPYWMAPEVIESETKYGTGVDIWSMGVVMFELLTGSPPHRRLSPTEAMLKIVKEPPPRLYAKWFSREVSDIVAQCLTKDPAQRPSAEKLLSTKYLQAHSHGPPSDFKAMIDSVVRTNVQRFINAKPAGIEQLSILAPPLTKHSRIDPKKPTHKGEVDEGTYWDFNDSPKDNGDDNDISPDSPDVATSSSTDSDKLVPSIPERKRPVEQIRQQQVQQRYAQIRLQKQQQEQKQQQQMQQQQQQQQQQQRQLPSQSPPYPRHSILTNTLAQAWVDQTFANVESRVSIPRCIQQIQKLHREFDDINRLYPGFTVAFVQEIRRAMH